MTFPLIPPPSLDRVYMVSFQMRPKRNVTGVIEELQSFPKWSHHIDNTWMIVTSMLGHEIWEKLAPHFRDADTVIIMEIRKGASYQGWMPNEAWDWINGAPYRE